MGMPRITELDAGDAHAGPSTRALDAVVITAPSSPYQLHRIRLRPLQESDYSVFREMHHSCFPVDYEDAYFRQAIRFQDSIVTWVAVEENLTGGHERMVGFISFKTYPLYNCDPVDRKLLGLDSRLLDGDMVAYILTLGVAQTHRKQGIASSLISKALDATTTDTPCRAIYLHVIQYNQQARRLYAANEFHQLACLKDFYDIRTGRQPDPSVNTYDAYFYAKHLMSTEAPLTLASILYALASPLRPLLRYIAPCVPPLSAGSLGVQGGAPNGFAGMPMAPPMMSPFGHSLRQAFS